MASVVSTATSMLHVKSVIHPLEGTFVKPRHRGSLHVLRAPTRQHACTRIGAPFVVAGKADEKNKAEEKNPFIKWLKTDKDAGRDKPERNTIFDDPKSFVKEVWNSRKAAEAVDGEDVLWSMRVDLTRALVGGEMPLSYQRLEKCMDCEGAGNMKWSTIKCSTCNGKGRKKTDRIINVKVPAGVTDGAQLRLRDQGDVGFAEGKTGNLVLRVEVPASGYVNGLRTWREDGHVYSEVPKVMVVGSEPSTVDVQLLDGKKGQLKVPADAKNGTTLRLKGRGSPLAVGKDEKGDLCFVIAEVVRSP